MRVYRDATTVVDYRHRTVGVKRDFHPRRETRHRLVDRVVNDLAHQMEHALGSGRPDVHARTPSDRFQTLHHRDIVSGVILRTGVTVCAADVCDFNLLCRHMLPYQTQLRRVTLRSQESRAQDGNTRRDVQRAQLATFSRTRARRACARI